jgi:hypothetical protein
VTLRSNLAAALGGLLLVVCGPGSASEVVTVGRVSIELPGPGWQVHAASDPGTVLSGVSLTHRQQTETKVVLRRAADQTIDVVVMVRANTTGKGRFSGVVYPNAKCEGQAGMFSEGDASGPAAWSFRCLLVSPPGAVTVPDSFFEKIQADLGREGWKLAPAMHIVIAKQYAHTGAFVDMTTLVVPEALPMIPDTSEPLTESIPKGVSAASVHWGRQLQQAATDSVYSVRGRLTVPPLLPLPDAPSRSN